MSRTAEQPIETRQMAARALREAKPYIFTSASENSSKGRLKGFSEERENQPALPLDFHTALPYSLGMTFIETSVFTKHIQEYLSDDEYAALQHFLNWQPEAGDIVPASGGVRKLRWAMHGRGKRGGIRVIYYWKKSEHEIWMLTAYAKNEKENIPAHILKKIAEEISND